jgi:hypothetical protein
MVVVVDRWPLSAEARVRGSDSVNVEFVADKVVVEQVLLRVLWFYPVNIITLWLLILIYYLGEKQ